jgi:hypothetical protein
VARYLQVANKLQLVRRAVPPSEGAAQLRGLVQHRYELKNEMTQRKNKLTAIAMSYSLNSPPSSEILIYLVP